MLSEITIDISKLTIAGMKTYLFHGPSGSGKDTQVERLMQEYELERIATGEMLRILYEENDPDGLEARQFWSAGKWVPDELTYRMLSKWMERYDTNKNWIFVSAVRAPGQIPF